MNHLSDRVLIVTGAASGFGALIVEMAARRGARVLGLDVAAKPIATLADRLRADGLAVEGRAADVTDLTQLRSAAVFAVERFGAIDVLVNNAGMMPLAFFADHDAAASAWSAAIDVNIKGVIHGIAAVHDQMISQGRGHVVNISSTYGNYATAGSGVYSATKAAVNVLSEALRVESQGRIKVSTVRPTGVLGTRLGRSIINPDATIGMVGQNAQTVSEQMNSYYGGTMEPALLDPDDVRFWAITPEQIAEAVLHVIDQPWGVSISDLTVRASGERYIL